MNEINLSGWFSQEFTSDDAECTSDDALSSVFLSFAHGGGGWSFRLGSVSHNQWSMIQIYLGK